MADDQDLKNLFREMLGEIRKTNSRTPNSSQRKFNTRTSRKTIEDSSEDIIDSFKRLRREIEINKESLQKNSINLRAIITDLITPTASLRRTFENAKKSLEQQIKYSKSENFKKVSIDTMNVLQNAVKSGKNINVILDSIASGQEKFKQVRDALLSITEEVQLKNKKVQLEAKKSDIQDEISLLKKNKKSQAGKKDELSQLEKELSGLNDALAAVSFNNAKYKQDYDIFLKEFEEIQKKHFNILGNINLEELKYEKVEKLTVEKRKQLLTEIMGAMNGIKAGAGNFSDSLGNYSNIFKDAKAQFKNALLSFVKTTVIVGGRQIIEDYNATKRYNLRDTGYGKAFGMGMSQAELATLVGQNKTFLRVMGKGNEMSPVQTGQLSDLQNAAKMFGVYGKDAAELTARFGSLQLELGQSVNPRAIKSQMEDFKKLSDVTDMTVEQLQDFYTELNQSGYISSLNSKYASKSEEERQKAVNSEIEQRYKLNKVLGYSNEYLKQQIQLQNNAKYANIEQRAREYMGSELLLSTYKDISGEQLSGKQAELLKLAATRNTAGLSADEQKQAAALLQKAQIAMQQTLENTQLEMGKKVSAGGAMDFALNLDKISQIEFTQKLLPAVSPDQLQEAANAGRKAQQQSGKGILDQLISQAGPIVSDIFGMFSGKNIGDVDVKQVGEAASSSAKALNALGTTATEVAEKLTGLGKNPAGAAGTSSFINLGASVINLIAATKGIKDILGAFRGGGGILNSLKNIFSTVGARATTAEVAATAATAARTALPLVARYVPHVGAFLTGAAIGTGIEDYYANTDYGNRRGRTANLMAENNGTLFGSIKSLVYELNPFMVNMTDKQLDMMEKRQQYDSLIKERLSYDKDFGKLSIDKKISELIQSGVYNVADLKSMGANENFLLQLNNAQKSISDMLSPDMVMDGTNNDTVADLLKKLNDNVEKLTKETVNNNKDQKLRAQTQEEIDKRINNLNDANKRSFEMSKQKMGA